jgi:hypothetical protein
MNVDRCDIQPDCRSLFWVDDVPNIAAMAHSISRNTRPSGRSSASRSDSPAICQRQRGHRLFCAPHLVKNKAVYVALALNPDGEKDVLGLWIEQTEGAKFWLKVINELKGRGVNDILVAVVDGL